MGSALNKDSNVKIHMTLAKRVHYAGEYVEGAVHVVCLENRPYRNVHIRLEGKEEIHWS